MMNTSNCRLSLPPKYAPYIKQEKCSHCARLSIFKNIIDLECECCAKTVERTKYDIPILECNCDDCPPFPDEKYTNFLELDYLRTIVEDEIINRSIDNDKCQDIIVFTPNYSGSKELIYTDLETYNVVRKWSSNRKWKHYRS